MFLSSALALLFARRPPRFEAASVHLCGADLPANARTGAGSVFPGSLEIECRTLMGLIQMAYVIFGNAHRVTPATSLPIEGGPSWKATERFDIRAKADSPASQLMQHGPMLQQLLEDRVGLKVHRETRQVPVYALIVAKGGSNLKPFHPGDCAPFDSLSDFPPPEAPANACHSRGSEDGGLIAIEAKTITTDDFCRFFLNRLDRPVINRTGLEGRFDIQLRYTPDDAGPELSGPSVFSAVERLGLKLSPIKGPSDVLAVDSVQRPTEN